MSVSSHEYNPLYLINFFLFSINTTLTFHQIIDDFRKNLTTTFWQLFKILAYSLHNFIQKCHDK